MSRFALSKNKKSSNKVLFWKSPPAIHLSFNTLKNSYNSNLATSPFIEDFKFSLLSVILGKSLFNLVNKLFWTFLWELSINVRYSLNRDMNWVFDILESWYFWVAYIWIIGPNNLTLFSVNWIFISTKKSVIVEPLSLYDIPTTSYSPITNLNAVHASGYCDSLIATVVVLPKTGNESTT